MAKLRLCILLGIGLLAPGLGPQAATSGTAPPAWGPPSPDTSGVFAADSGQGRHSPGFDRYLHRSWWRGSRATRDVGTGALGVASHVAGTSSTGSPIADPNLWGANGNVLDIARSGSTLYIAGSFRSVGENSGGFVPVDARTGEALRPFPKVAGPVNVIVPDGSGGWYIGGEFTVFGGKPRACLAQVRADGSVTDWNPSVTGSPGYIDPPVVIAMAIHGSRLFVGGAFREIGGRPHENLGCVDVATGAVLDWDLDTNVEGGISALAVHDSLVFVGGYFSEIGGQPRTCLAAVDASSGEVSPWRADATYGVMALLPRGDTLFVAGEFGGIAGIRRRMVAAVDIPTAQVLPFDARALGIYLDYVPFPSIHAMTLVGDTLYVAGNFIQIGGQPRHSVAALDAITGDALSWITPQIGPTLDGFPPRLCDAITVSGGVVYVGGWFESFGTESRPFAAAFSQATGALLPWNPKPDQPVGLILPRGDTVLVGGIFSLMGEWKHRAGLAAIDLTTGTVKPWNPNPNGVICTAIAVKGDRVFVSGAFTSIGGDRQPRQYFAALDTLNGEVTDWNPGGNSVGTVFLLRGDTLYVGGEFTQVGGQPRNYVAALDATTAEILPWDPNADWPVNALARSGDSIYVGGSFQRIGGQWRPCLAAVDALTGAVSAWDPQVVPGIVDALLVSGNKLYVGGGFEQIGGQARNSIAALDVETGSALPWYPGMSGWGAPSRVYALALLDSALIVGGRFGTIGGQSRICLAAVDTATGLATDWDPGLDGLVWTLAAEGSTLHVGGGFTRAGGLPAVGLAAFSAPGELAPAPLAFALSQSIPNPARSNAIIRFSLPQAAAVTLSIYDLQGRRVATLLNHAFQEAGRHDVPVHADRWRPGVYLYRLEAGGRTATRKMVVLE